MPSPIAPVIAIVTGSRDWTDPEPIERALFGLVRGSKVLHGAAKGADLIADGIARAIGLKTYRFPADWTRHGKSAGPIRNRDMAATAKVWSGRDRMPVVCLAFPLPQSVGTLDMIALCEAEGWEVRRG